MEAMSVELRLRDTFINFHPEPDFNTPKSRSTSTPPSLNALFECRASSDMRTEYLENLVERASRLESRPLPEVKGKAGRNKTEEKTIRMPMNLNSGWTCGRCGVHSDSNALFCWNCGLARPQTQHSAASAIANKMQQFPGGVQIYNGSASDVGDHFDGSKVTSSARASKMQVIPIKSENVDSRSAYANTPGIQMFTGSTTDGGSTHESILAEDDSGTVDTPVTTVMISCIPVRLGVEQLLGQMDSVGFNGKYDLVYMPYRSVKKRGKVQHGSPGYAFVNFKSPELATEFMTAFEGYPFGDFHSDRKAVLKPAATQGYHANLALHARDKKQHGSIITFN